MRTMPGFYMGPRESKLRSPCLPSRYFATKTSPHPIRATQLLFVTGSSQKGQDSIISLSELPFILSRLSVWVFFILRSGYRKHREFQQSGKISKQDCHHCFPSGRASPAGRLEGNGLTFSPCLDRHHPAIFSPAPLQPGPQGESFFTLEKAQELIKDDAWPGISE